MQPFDLLGPLPAPRSTTVLEASAGTGKTFALAGLVTRYLAEGRATLDQMLLVTFSRSATQELRERVRSQIVQAVRAFDDPSVIENNQVVEYLLTGTDEELEERKTRLRDALAAFDAATIATTHQFCNLVLKSLGVAGDSDAGVELVESLDDLVAEIVDDLYLAHFGRDRDDPQLPYPEALELAREVVNNPAAQLRPAEPDPDSRAAVCLRFVSDVVRELETRKRRRGILGYDDLLTRLADALDEPDAPARLSMHTRWPVVMVDEFQDTVGDDDQGIYGWRGATLDNLKKLPVDYPQLQVIKLEQNYRSTSAILRAANNVIGPNPKLFPKTLFSELGEGEPVRVVDADSEEHEAERAVARLQGLRAAGGTKLSDFAVLYRANHQSKAFEQKLRAAQIPYKVSGGQSFFDRAEIRDLCAWLRLLVNQDDDPAFLRAVTVPRRGVGPATLEALGRYAGHRHISLFAAAFEEGAAEHLGGRQIEALRDFGHFINRVAHRAAREAAGPVMDDLLKAIGYEAWLYESCDPREAETKWSNVGDFTGWLGRKGEEDGKTLLRADPDHRADVHARQGRPRLRRRADGHPARLQGPGVSACVPGRRRGGPAAAPEQHRRGQGRGRAPPDVRRHHPRATQPQPDLVRAAQVGQGVPHLRAEPLHRRDGRRHQDERPQDRTAGDEGRRQGAAGEPDGDVREPRQGLSGRSLVAPRQERAR